MYASYLGCYHAYQCEDENGVKTCEDVPVDQEDGGEIVEDDSCSEDTDETAEDCQETVQRHGRTALY